MAKARVACSSVAAGLPSEARLSKEHCAVWYSMQPKRIGWETSLLIPLVKLENRSDCGHC